MTLLANPYYPICLLILPLSNRFYYCHNKNKKTPPAHALILQAQAE
jgi:hypothetical protein